PERVAVVDGGAADAQRVAVVGALVTGGEARALLASQQDRELLSFPVIGPLRQELAEGGACLLGLPRPVAGVGQPFLDLGILLAGGDELLVDLRRAPVVPAPVPVLREPHLGAGLAGAPP